MSRRFVFFNSVSNDSNVGVDPKFVMALGKVDEGVEIVFSSGTAGVVKGSMKSVADTLEGIYDHEWDYSDLRGERRDDETDRR